MDLKIFSYQDFFLWRVGGYRRNPYASLCVSEGLCVCACL